MTEQDLIEQLAAALFAEMRKAPPVRDALVEPLTQVAACAFAWAATDAAQFAGLAEMNGQHAVLKHGNRADQRGECLRA
jgi:hypothetical protein